MGKRVLVIEDEVNISEALQFILSRDGWDVLTHAEGGDAVNVVGRTGPDVLILDVMLPGRSGYDILQALRGADATAHLPVLMLTAKGQAADRALAQQMGATRFMSKPFANAEIIAAIRELANHTDTP